MPTQKDLFKAWCSGMTLTDVVRNYGTPSAAPFVEFIESPPRLPMSDLPTATRYHTAQDEAIYSQWDGLVGNEKLMSEISQGDQPISVPDILDGESGDHIQGVSFVDKNSQKPCRAIYEILGPGSAPNTARLKTACFRLDSFFYSIDGQVFDVDQQWLDQRHMSVIPGDEAKELISRNHEIQELVAMAEPEMIDLTMARGHSPDAGVMKAAALNSPVIVPTRSTVTGFGKSNELGPLKITHIANTGELINHSSAGTVIAPAYHARSEDLKLFRELAQEVGFNSELTESLSRVSQRPGVHEMEQSTTMRRMP